MERVVFSSVAASGLLVLVVIQDTNQHKERDEGPKIGHGCVPTRRVCVEETVERDGQEDRHQQDGNHDVHYVDTHVLSVTPPLGRQRNYLNLAPMVLEHLTL